MVCRTFGGDLCAEFHSFRDFCNIFPHTQFVAAVTHGDLHAGKAVKNRVCVGDIRIQNAALHAVEVAVGGFSGALDGDEVGEGRRIHRGGRGELPHFHRRASSEVRRRNNPGCRHGSITDGDILPGEGRHGGTEDGQVQFLGGHGDGDAQPRQGAGDLGGTDGAVGLAADGAVGGKDGETRQDQHAAG